MFQYSFGNTVRPGDRVEITFTNGMRHIAIVPSSYVVGMTVDSDLQIVGHRVLESITPKLIEEEDAEDVDFDYDEGLAGKW